jgi:ABC-2 type transport system ATP-binding protein
MADVVIRTIGLTRRYGTRRGIDALDLEVFPGEIVGYLGPNGAGKTTTIRLLLDLIRPTSGRAELFGLDSHRDGLSARARIGYLPGGLRLYESLSGTELLAYLGHLRGRPDATRVARIAQRLDCDLTREIRTMSHGTRQKVGLVAAMAADPELLILDEPTTGLDPLVQLELFGLLEEVRAAGRTVFLSSHVLPEVERVCDRVAFIREGRLVALEDVAAFKGRAIRRVEIRFGAPVDPAPFAALAGVGEVRIDGPTLGCAVTGSFDALIKEAARHEVLGLATSESSLEDLFLAHYRREPADAA